MQRLAELLLEPRRQYKSTVKFMNGVEKLVSVSSVLDAVEGQDPDLMDMS